MSTQATENTMTPKMDDELAALLESAAFEEEETPEATPEINDEEALEGVVEKLEMKEAKDEIYAEQNDEKPAPDFEASNNNEKIEDTKKSEKKPRAKRVALANMDTQDAIKTILGNELDAYFAFDYDDSNLDVAALEAKVSERMNTVTSLAKKERLKSVNLFKHLKDDSKLNVYTGLALKLLIERGTINSLIMRDYFTSQHKNGVKSYSMGTANAQTTQFMHLLPAFECAIVDGKNLVLNPNSTIVAHYKTSNGIS